MIGWPRPHNYDKAAPIKFKNGTDVENYMLRKEKCFLQIVLKNKMVSTKQHDGRKHHLLYIFQEKREIPRCTPGNKYKTRARIHPILNTKIPLQEARNCILKHMKTNNMLISYN